MDLFHCREVDFGQVAKYALTLGHCIIYRICWEPETHPYPQCWFWLWTKSHKTTSGIRSRTSHFTTCKHFKRSFRLSLHYKKYTGTPSLQCSPLVHPSTLFKCLRSSLHQIFKHIIKLTLPYITKPNKREGQTLWSTTMIKSFCKDWWDWNQIPVQLSGNLM